MSQTNAFRNTKYSSTMVVGGELGQSLRTWLHSTMIAMTLAMPPATLLTLVGGPLSTASVSQLVHVSNVNFN